MLTGRRYRLYLTPAQADYAERIAGTCRAVWNTALEQRREYRRRGAWIGYVEQARQMAEAKRDRHCSWLADAPSHTLQQTLQDLDRACREHGTWAVKWRSKSGTAPSFRFPDPKQIKVNRLNERWGAVWLPKFGWTKFRWTRQLGGQLRHLTVKRVGMVWFACFCIEDGLAEAPLSALSPVGVDRGVNVFMATSDGELTDRSFASPSEIERVRRLQQKLARQRKQSNRRNSTKVELSTLHARIRDRRADFTSQVATSLARKHGLVAIEDLKVRSMTASARGTLDKPGRNVRQKSGLNRSILDKGWSLVLSRLLHVARYYGCAVVKVSPAYTSQTCSACKHIAAESRESQARFRCVDCGYQDNADVNAAKNILAAGLAVTGRGDLAIRQSVKRQPSEELVA